MIRSLFFVVVSAWLTSCATKTTTSSQEVAFSPLETIDREGVQNEIRNHQSEIKGCYERALKEDPKLEGKVVLKIEIDGQGRVSKADPLKERSTLNSPKVTTCMSDEMKTWLFPKPPEGLTAEIIYPFTFSNKK